MSQDPSQSLPSPTSVPSPGGEGEPSALRTAERVQEDYLAFRIGFYDGFMASADGWNGEYPNKPVRDEWLEKRSDEYAREQVAKEALAASTASPIGGPSGELDASKLPSTESEGR